MQRESEEVKCQVPVALTSTDGCIEHKAVSFNPQTWLSAHGWKKAKGVPNVMVHE